MRKAKRRPASAPEAGSARRRVAEGRLLLLVPTTSYRIGDFLAAAERLGAEVAVGSNHRPVLEAFSEGRTVAVDFRDLDRGAAQIAAFDQRHPLAAIVGVDDETTVLAARASATLGLRHNSSEAVATCRDKHRFRQALAAAGLPGPGFRRFSAGEDPERAATLVRYPCVLKPLALAGSRGVIRADDPTAFAAAFRRIKRILRSPDAALAGELGRFILVEDYVPGVEVAVEGLMRDGRLDVLAIFDKPDPLEGPFFEETIYVTPSRLAPSQRAALVAATADAVAAVGLREGPVHAELRLNRKGPCVIEIAARSIGGLCARVLRFGAGVRLEDLILRHALELPIASVERERRAAGVMMLPIPSAGRLVEVRGQGAALAVEGIEGLTITIPSGEAVAPLPEGHRYLGFLFAKAESPAAVEAALREAQGRLDVVIDADRSPAV